MLARAQRRLRAFRITGGAVIGTGTLTSNADYDIQGGTVNVRLIGDVGLEKTGTDLATLAGANNYRGATTVDEATLKVTGGISGTSGVTIAESATLELAHEGVGAIFAIANDGTLLLSAGLQNIKTITGNGTTRLGPGTTLTVESIAQGSLVIGFTGAATASAAVGTAVNPVPEPSAVSLLFAGTVCLIFSVFQRRRASS